MIELLLFVPVILSILLLLLRLKLANIIATLLYGILSLILSIMLYLQPQSFTAYFKVDQLNIIFLLVLSVLFAGVSIYNISFLMNDKESNIRQTYYTAGLLLFAASMMGVILSTHLALLWVFVEATTLTSAYLIYYHRSESALEATWKYLFICSIGIAIAFIGITLLSMGLVGTDSLFFDDLAKNAKNIDPFWLKISFPFILVGFGTKVGFAPVHAWLPDAHSESPSPVSALLSGTLLNAALLGIIRVNKIMTIAEMGSYVSTLLLLLGFTSLFVTAVYIGIVKNYKRMLAYSSIENMGIIAIGLGVGGIGLFAAILHLIAHSLTKASLFLTSGNILHNYNSKEIDDVNGMLRYDRTNGWLWILSFVSIAGLPPFPIFISEFFITKAMFQNGQYVLAVLFLLLLTIILAGMAMNIFKMSFGTDAVVDNTHSSGIFTWAPQVVFLIILLLFGIMLPDSINSLIQAAIINL